MAQLLPGSEPAAPSGQALGPNFDSHHYLSIVIYLLSNDLVDMDADPNYEVGMSSILETTFTLVSRRLLTVLLQSRLPSIKAAWEKLLLGAGELMNKEAFTFLISVGMDNDWLDEHGNGYDYLFPAARMNCSDILHALLARGCRPDSPSATQTPHESIIMATLRTGNPDCAKVLIQHCDVNHVLQSRHNRIRKVTTFSAFIMDFDDTNPDCRVCLRLFLGQGADVDYELGLYTTEWTPQHHSEWYWKRFRQLEEYWPLSILDYLYYFHHPVFSEMAEYCDIPSRFSRARALSHSDQGEDALRKYLASDPEFPTLWGEAIGNDTEKAKNLEQKNRCLEILLAEQFLFSVHRPQAKSWWRAVEGLSKLEIDLTWLSQTKGLAGDMLYATARLITFGEGPDKEQGLQILQWLLNKGFKVRADALAAAAVDDECAVLECLASLCDDLEKESGEALIRAVENDDFDAMKRLLDIGASLNTIDDQGVNVFERAACESSLDTMKYLVQRGAKPRTSEQGGHPSRALMQLFFYGVGRVHVVDFFNKVQYITEEHITINEPSCPSSRLLEMCVWSFFLNMQQRRTVFEFLLKKGARLSPGSPLALWIATGGGHRVVREMLDAGADPDAYSSDDPNVLDPFSRRTPLQAAAGIGDYTLVCLLLERGADLNRPARGRYGITALQAICIWDPVRREERLRKDKIIKLLLDKGANVNAENPDGQTALHFVALRGDLSTAFILLKHGAKLDVISEPLQTALDVAACYGRLDMVDFLLNANALSWTACSDGKEYDGAIEWARKGHHFVVSELICKHAADRHRWDVPRRQTVARSIPLEHTPPSLSLRAELETLSWSHAEGRLTPSDTLQDTVLLDQINSSSYMLDEDMVESGNAASKANGKGMPGAEATDMSWTRVIEEIEDEPSLADTGYDSAMFRGENGGGNASRTSGAGRASSGPGGWLYRPTDQNWIEDEQQNVDPPISSSLTTDVFMGFSESPRL